MTTTQSYRVSALAFGLVRMWRGWSVILPVVLVNALLQALLVWPDPTPGDALAWLLAAVSALVFVASFGLLAVVALRVSDGPVSWSMALGMMRASGVRYALWALALLVALTVGLALAVVPGLVLLALTPFLLLAALDGQRNPIAANFHAMGERFGRWLVTVAIIGIAVLVGSILMGMTAFFVRGSIASFLAWLVAGLVITWFTVAWGLIYRSTTVARRTT